MSDNAGVTGKNDKGVEEFAARRGVRDYLVRVGWVMRHYRHSLSEVLEVQFVKGEGTGYQRFVGIQVVKGDGYVVCLMVQVV